MWKLMRDRKANYGRTDESVEILLLLFWFVSTSAFCWLVVFLAIKIVFLEALPSFFDAEEN